MVETQERPQTEIQTSLEKFEAARDERSAKTNSFIESAQDGSKVLVRHCINLDFLELIEVQSGELQYASNALIEKQNEQKIKELQTSLIEQATSFVLDLSSKQNLVSIGVNYQTMPTVAPPVAPPMEQTAKD